MWQQIVTVILYAWQPTTVGKPTIYLSLTGMFDITFDIINMTFQFMFIITVTT